MDRVSNLNTLLAFVTVAHEGSVSRAAEVLNLTQPAVSHQLKRLAAETGITLFTRSPRGLTLTEDGAALIEKAEAVLNALSEFRRSARQRSGRISGKLKIGTIVDPEFIRLGRLLKEMRTDFPDIQTELVHGVSGETLLRLRRGQIDAGFYLSGPGDLEALGQDQDAPIHAERLANFTYRVIAPAGWQDRIANAHWPQLAALPWIGTPEVSAHHRLLAQIFTQHDCQQNVVALVDQEASMLEMVRSGVGLSLCRESIALHQRQSFGLAVCESVSVPACLSFITLQDRTDSPAISALYALLERTW
ncbi:LysR family transcriptional regulator [Thalassovita sp.]|jgi:DNA-binding transcriptional LysR family regulator|uniref:LysR family transcriptional regulator n=1 Tax=Thalassovita sp. TaxID=1979401 RepID=UPI003B5AA082